MSDGEVRLLERFGKVEERLAKVEATIGNYNANIERFYAGDWPRVESRVQAHEDRIVALERHDVERNERRLEQLETKCERLEKWRAYLLGAWVVGVTVAAVLAGVIVRAVETRIGLG